MKNANVPNALHRLLAMVAACIIATGVSAQQRTPLLADGFPAKPIKITVSTAPGGGLDIVTRAMTSRLSENIGSAVIVDNNGGASGSIAVNMVASSAPDGYTLLSTGGTLLINAAFKRYERDILQSLAPVVRMSSSYYFLIVPPSTPVQNMTEFLAYARKNPGKINYGSNGIGSVIHLGLEMLEAGAGLDMVHVPYKGVAPANVDLAAGRLQVGLASVSGMQLVKAGKARALATTMPQRHPDYPELPTIAESGVPGYEVANTYMIYAPIRIPAPILAALNREAVRALAAPDMKAKLAADGALSAAPYTPAELRKLFVEDFNRWDTAIKKAGVTAPQD
jgi:tripartite-type tricarboxylate transporter receptor subunit TctC